MTYNLSFDQFLLITECVCTISGKGSPTWWEHLRTLVGGQLPQGEENLIIFEIRSVTNPHLVAGWRGGMGVFTDSYIKPVEQLPTQNQLVEKEVEMLSYTVAGYIYQRPYKTYVHTWCPSTVP